MSTRSFDWNDLDNWDDDAAYAARKLPLRWYVSSRFTRTYGDDGRPRRFATRVWDDVHGFRFDRQEARGTAELEPEPIRVAVAKEEVLRSGGDGPRRFQLKALLLEDTRRVERVILQKFTTTTGLPHKNGPHISLSAAEATALVKFLMALPNLTLPTTRGCIDDDYVETALESLTDAPRVDTLIDQINALGLTDQVLAKLAAADTRSEHLLALAHRQEQLECFRRLLDDPSFFEQVRSEWDCRGDEAVWQRFFERNTWILGYGLNYQFGEAVAGRSIEQVVRGSSIASEGKRVDGLLKTLGAINSLCFVELKIHTTPLLRKSSHRPGVYAASTHLIEAVSQVQATVQAAAQNLGEVLNPRDRDDFPTGETLFNVAPRALVICGSLDQLVRDGQVSHERVRSFELFRRSITTPEIITFDELYERAKFIVASKVPRAGDRERGQPERAPGSR